MPLLKDCFINQKLRLIIWDVQEDDSFFTSRKTRNLNVQVSNSKRQTEKLVAAWLWLEYLTHHRLYLYGENGKPVSPNQTLSISHSGSLVGIFLCSDMSLEVGLDIQHITQQLYKTQHKYCSADELNYANNELIRLAKIWTAKEAVYKCLGLNAISWREGINRVLEHEDKTTYRIMDKSKTRVVNIHFKTTGEYGISYCTYLL